MEKTERGFKRIHYSWKNWETRDWLEFISNTNKHAYLRQEAHVSFSFGDCFSLQTPQIHQFEDKNGFINSKNPVSISLWNLGNPIKGYLSIQTDHNEDHKCPDYGQLVTINMYDQSMISLFSYGRFAKTEKT